MMWIVNSQRREYAQKRNIYSEGTSVHCISNEKPDFGSQDLWGPESGNLFAAGIGLSLGLTQMPADLMMNWVRPTILCAKKEEISDRYTQYEAYSCNSL